MKVKFDGPLKPQDTILMNLYKRVYPKWAYSLTFPPPARWVREDGVNAGAVDEHEEMKE